MSRPIPFSRILIAALLAAPILAACDGDGPTVGAGSDPARLRVFNAVVNASAVRPGQAIDVLVDSSTAAPGAAALPRGEATPFADAAPGAHRFEARITGDARPGGAANLFGSSARAVTLGGFGYTLFAIGAVPASGSPLVAPLLLADDPFPPSQTPDGSALHARIRLVNAAPYAGGAAGTGALLQGYVTDGNRPPPGGVLDLAPSFTAGYRNAAGPLELPAGRYHVTVARLNGSVVARATVDLAAGHARTLAVISEGATAAPSPANHRIAVLADRDF